MPAERRLWGALTALDLASGHFRRQVPIGPYFADFAHHGVRLVVELDGDQHGHLPAQARDAARTTHLEQRGYRVLRFWNHEALGNLDGVVSTILAALGEPPPTPDPSPSQAGVGERAPSSNDGPSPC